MAVFLNGNKIDLGKACNITTGCQSPAGTHNINGGCMADQSPGADFGISGSIFLSASAFGLSSIGKIGVAVSEPSGTGTVLRKSSYM